MFFENVVVDQNIVISRIIDINRFDFLKISNVMQHVAKNHVVVNNLTIFYLFIIETLI